MSPPRVQSGHLQARLLLWMGGIWLQNPFDISLDFLETFISRSFSALLASCSSGCVNGDCVSPNNCSCNAHSHGISCNICDDGWTGADCMTPICLSGCQHGSCTVPNTCVCDPRWNGTKCELCANGWSTPAKLCTIGMLILTLLF